MDGPLGLCSVCQEGLWNQLVRRTGVIEGVFDNSTSSLEIFGVTLMPLAQFRKDLVAGPSRESYSVDWTWAPDTDSDSIDRPDLANQTLLELPKGEAHGLWWATVTLHSEEVRRWDKTSPNAWWAINRERTGIYI